ncbi:hypothetical protein [Novosphingobium meiothermophilum]|uniref:hypothetical protein n=1 Tax=Novosphingobium meiothermophilum TaxID=2202251 RepID=UPI000D6E34A8|nr:hypothetical protein [Novosphingobium meiothermophilum]
MCSVKTPKVQADPNANKPLPIIRNPFLDGFDPAGQLRIGKQNLRIDLGSGTPASSAPGYTSPPPTAAAAPMRTPFIPAGLQGFDAVRAGAAEITRRRAMNTGG